MAFEFLSSPTVIRRELRRLADQAEEIELFIGAIDDEKLINLLIKAAKRGSEVNITLEFDQRTTPDAIDRLIEAGVNVGTFEPAEFNRRSIERFGARIWLFENLTAWTTGAIVGSLDATTASIQDNLEAATLVESNSFTGRDKAGDYLMKLLQWIDNLNFKPLGEKLRAEHREQFEARQRLAKAAGGRSDSIVEVKTPFISPLSWQELRGCEWATYFRGLLDAEIQRDEKSARRLSGERGWLTGIDDAQYAYREGPDRWTDAELRAMLLGETEPAGCLGKCEREELIALLEHDAAFRAKLHEAVERCIADRSRDSMMASLTPLLEIPGSTVPVLTRFLAIAAPDRYVSILERETALRLSDMVGFDVTGIGLDPAEHLSRYLDAVEQIQAFPWASEMSAERSTEHPDEADAWSKRVALLGCFVC